MKKLPIIALIIAFSIGVNAQPMLVKSKPDAPLSGIKKDIFMQAEIKAGQKFKITELINNFISHYKSIGFVHEDFKIDEIADNQKEFKFPIVFTLPMQMLRGMMGLKSYANPIQVIFYVHISIEDDKITLSLDDFDEKAFYKVKNNNYYVYEVETETGLSRSQKELLESYQEIVTATWAESSVVLKTLALISDGPEALKTGLNELKEINEKQFKLYEQMEKEGLGKWLSDDEMLKYYEDKKVYQTMKEIGTERIANGYFLVITNQRWKMIKMSLLRFIKENSDIAFGKIISISINDQKEFENIDGKVLPTNPEERKKWEKSNITL